jgi:hypothetical protein
MQAIELANCKAATLKVLRILSQTLPNAHAAKMTDFFGGTN